MMKRWMENINSGKKLSDYFINSGFRSVAIYGAGDLGKLVFEELNNTDVKVTYFIDRNAKVLKKFSGISVILPSDYNKLDSTDVIIITMSKCYDEISRMFAACIPEVGTISLWDAVCECGVM